MNLIKFSIITLCLFLIVSCDDDGGNNANNINNINNTNNTNNQNLPELRCQSTPSTEVDFVDVSEDVKLDPANEHVLGNRLGAVDLNGDGYPDLIIHKTSGGKRDEASALPSERGKRILFNVEDPDNPGERIFVDQTASSGYDLIGGTDERGRGASFAVAGDFNNDHNIDLLSVVYAPTDDEDIIDRTVLLTGDGSGTFTLVDEDFPFSEESSYSASAAALTDFNKDGTLDIFMGYFYKQFGVAAQQDRLYRNSGMMTFSDNTSFSGITTTTGGNDENRNHKPTYGVTVCDINQDGAPDLLSSSYGRAYNMLWINDGEGVYEDHSLSSGFAADDNTDYSDNQFYICHCQVNPGPECDEVEPGQQMIQCDNDYWNVGYDDQPWRNAGNTFSTVCADLNNNGQMDVYHASIRHWHIGDSSDPSEALYNTGETPISFERPGLEASGLDREHTITDWNEGDIVAMALDYNNDGLLDIMVGDSDYPQTRFRIFRQKSDNTFEEAALEEGVNSPRAVGATWLDYDQDGDLDILIGFSTMRCSSSDEDCIFDEPRVRLWQNNGGSDANRVVVRLQGKGGYGYSNISAIGALVKVTVDGVTMTRELQSGFGHFGIQTPLDLHFGLGDSCEIERLEIIWPNVGNTSTVIENISANYIYYVEEENGLVSWEDLPVN
ncbi:MAG: CRTAC1 family protein [Deltaproteobacteria bacterium]|jgi:hypothetical protein|nr:CRTAC1 family protein [Deltaproteobacteria bacterium]